MGLQNNFVFATIIAIAIADSVHFNEVFLDSESVFVELYTNYEEKEAVDNEIKRYGILVVKNAPIRATNYIDLGSDIVDRDRIVNSNLFFVISSSDETSNLAAHSPPLRNLYSSLKHDQEQIGIILLLHPDPSDSLLFGLNCDGRRRWLPEEIAFDDSMMRVVNKYATDAIFLKGESKADDIWVQNILPKFLGKPIVLPLKSYDIITFSLNRCVLPLFASDSFVFGPQSPGLLNYCSTELHLSVMVETVVDEEEQELLVCTNESDDAEENGNTEEEKKENVLDLHELVSSQHTLYPAFVTFLKRDDVKKYLKFELDQNTGEGKFVCTPCHHVEHLSEKPVFYNPRVRPQLMKEGMPFAKESKETLRVLKKHFGSDLHKQYAEFYETPRTESERKPVNIDVTAKLIGLVYVEKKMGLPSKQHKTLVTTLNYFKCYFGNYLQSHYAATTISNFLGKYVHDTMIDSMTASGTPFGLLLDCSTDISGKHGFLLYFTLLIKNKINVRMWRYVEAKEASGPALAEKIIRLVEVERNPDFPLFFKTHLSSITTDGASNLISQHASVVSLLREYVKNDRQGSKLPSYRCANHLLALSFNDVMYSTDPNLKFCKEIISQCNKLSKFYSTKSYRRRVELLDTATVLHEKARSFKQMKKARWIPATQESFFVINENYRIFTAHLQSISRTSSAKDYNAETRYQANTLLDKFTDKNMMATIYHLVDVMTELSRWTKSLEQKSSTVMDLKSWREDVLLHLQALIVVPGKHLEMFFEECNCGAGILCNLEIYELTETVNFRDMRLQDRSSGIPKLSETRQMVVNEMIEALERRFPESAISALSILHPENLVSADDNDWNKFMEFLHDHFNVPLSTKNDFLKLKDSLVSTGFYFRNKMLSADKFWESVLDSFTFTNSNVKQAIEIALVQPAGIARVESGFSMLNYIKDKHKTQMSFEAIENILNIKFNGDPVENMPFDKIAKKWIAENHRGAQVTKRRRCSSQNEAS